jgi:hypothetical protein
MYGFRSAKANRYASGRVDPPSEPCYVRATVIGSPANLRAGAAAATLLAIAGCGGGGESRSDSTAGARGTVAIERVAFPARQRIAQKSVFALTVRNAGDRTIGDLTVTLRGFSAYEGPQAPGRPRWLVDEPPPGSALAAGNAYATGPLGPGKRRTLRWRVTAVLPGTHKLGYEVASARLAGGRRARGTVSVRVIERPPFSRVNPRSGEVERE